MNRYVHSLLFLALLIGCQSGSQPVTKPKGVVTGGANATTSDPPPEKKAKSE